MLPQLGQVPSVAQESLTLKATATGITFMPNLKEELHALEMGIKPNIFKKFKRRYHGSKTSEVDINGNLVLMAPRQKKAPSVETPGGKVFDNAAQISENTADLPNVQQEKKPRFYRINKSQIRQRLHSYINTAKGKKELYFWTVSFPAHTPDNIAYRALNTWLTALRQRKMLKDYLWVAERQEGARKQSGDATHTIHFHIAIPHKMPVQRANAMMRGTLKTLCRKGELPYAAHSTQIKKYNGVDIAKHRKTGRVTNFAIQKGARSLASYLTKYVTKNDASFTHLAWHNSRGFSCLFLAVCFSIPEFYSAGFAPYLFSRRVFEMPFARFIPWKFGPPPLLKDHLFKLNTYMHEWLDSTRAERTGNSR